MATLPSGTDTLNHPAQTTPAAPPRQRRGWCGAWLVVLAWGAGVQAQSQVQSQSQSQSQSVSLQGSMGANKALLMIDGQPQTLAVGASARGVTLRRLGDGEAEVDVAGQRQLLRLGAAPSRIGAGGAAPGSGNTIVLPVAAGGHFNAAGTINGKPVNFVVDTGATYVALGQAEANRIGLDWKRGRPGLSQTANGTVPVYSVNLTAVRVGDVEISNVAAVVVPSDMPVVLLGNSFLNRFSMRRDTDVMRLEKRP